MTSRRRGVEPRLAIECLESRCLLAGNVTVSVSASGDLRIKGDSAGNCVEITQFDTDADTFVDTTVVSGCVGDDDTTINGGPGPFVTGLIGRDLKIDLKGGDDSVFIGFDAIGPTTGVLVPRHLKVDTGAGMDFVLVFAKVGGNTTIKTGADADGVALAFSEFFGKVDVRTSDGDDFVIAFFSLFHRKFDLEMDGGENDMFMLAESIFEDSMDADGGRGASDIADISDSNTFLGSVELDNFETVIM